MKILDMTAGNRAVWFNKANPLATYLDIRSEVAPDIVADCRERLPFDDETVDLVVFDPPHVNFGANAELSLTYGWHTTEEIRDLVRRGAKQAHRVLKPDGLMAFKWNDHDQKLDKVLALMPQFEPLVGHRVSIRTKHASSTQWVLLRKLDKV